MTREKSADCGVYKITNRLNGKFYVGSSKQITRRWRDHKRAAGKCPLISRAIKKYGAENFDFEIIEICNVVDLSQRELFYILSLCPAYNAIIATENAGFTHREETRAKMRTAHLGKKMGGGMREKISASMIEKHKNDPATIARNIENGKMHKGRKRSPETCAKIGDTHRGATHTDETKEKIRRAKNARYANDPDLRERIGAAGRGRVWTDEQRKKTIEARRNSPAVAAAREASRGRVQSPEERAMRSRALKASWAKRRASMAAET